MAEVKQKTVNFLAIMLTLAGLIVSVGYVFLGWQLTEALWLGGFLFMMVGVTFLEDPAIISKARKLEKGSVLILIVSIVVFFHSLELIFAGIFLQDIIKIILTPVQTFIAAFVFLQAIAMMTSLWK